MATARSLLPVLLLAAMACGGGSGAARKTVFDPTAVSGPPVGSPAEGTTNEAIETPYAPLDRAEAGKPPYLGMMVLRGGVHLSRPKGWTVRDASEDPGHAYVRYVSPRAYSFALYERSDAPDDLWRDILQRYEADVAAVGAKVVGEHIPVAVGASQGREYTIERKLEASSPAPSRSREILVRGEHRVVLVQIVMQGDDLPRLASELLDVLAHLEVT